MDKTIIFSNGVKFKALEKSNDRYIVGVFPSMQDYINALAEFAREGNLDPITIGDKQYSNIDFVISSVDCNGGVYTGYFSLRPKKSSETLEYESKLAAQKEIETNLRNSNQELTAQVSQLTLENEQLKAGVIPDGGGLTEEQQDKIAGYDYIFGESEAK